MKKYSAGIFLLGSVWVLVAVFVTHPICVSTVMGVHLSPLMMCRVPLSMASAVVIIPSTACTRLRSVGEVLVGVFRATIRSIYVIMRQLGPMSNARFIVKAVFLSCITASLCRAVAAIISPYLVACCAVGVLLTSEFITTFSDPGAPDALVSDRC